MRLLVLLILLTPLSSCYSQPKSPKLVVGIVVDQMKAEYLYRYADKFGDGGFKKIQNEGFVSKNTHYNYIPTYTAPGHASVYTGTTPRFHGIIGNGWYSKVLGRSVYCAGDSTVTCVGGSKNAGNISPRNLIATTITDELKLSTNFKSKVVGVSIKDRGAALPAGHTPDGAYWYDSKTGNFVTSTYYTSELPGWVTAFNEQKNVDKYSNGKWETSFPLKTYTASTTDDNQYERGFKGKDTPTFPYDLEKLREKNGPYGLISSTPFGNSLVADFAKAAITNESLGKDEITDFLAVSFSSTDYIGHNFGPNSIEIQDTYIKLDKEIEALLKYLDLNVGKGNYTIFITADHAVVANPLFLEDNKLPGGYADQDEFKKNVKTALTDNFGEGDWILNASNEQVFLNHQLIRESKWTKEDFIEVIKTAMLEEESTFEVYSAEDLKYVTSSDPMGVLLKNGYNMKLSGDLMLVQKPGYLFKDYGTTGTTHGSGFNYDTHVPLLFYGHGIKAGATVRRVAITDIAPTMAMLLNTSLPSACTGSPITELFK